MARSSTPVLKGEDSRWVSTSIRFPVAEYLAIKRAARREHKTVADYIRSRLPGTTVSGRTYNRRAQE